ncbi:hypothetical protein [Leptospira stimsonii]|uniref:Uncharacterized protein n=1 Tax=Leptospira stimsonii TaxID=2202203 RepID=A0A4R9L0C4_9LEPT|nr:hypothetical protein [Leptospira stimsonii]RHX83083.1 hypothetical protein DLM78_23060 [Leptospira stimsonii]TGK19064.1 hypothetical protein EHO98_11780 [Leptospira stimsonii]TGM11046.1 hypothetical protein EHQ90_17010 [Leptospira stimsonii]
MKRIFESIVKHWLRLLWFILFTITILSGATTIYIRSLFHPGAFSGRGGEQAAGLVFLALLLSFSILMISWLGSILCSFILKRTEGFILPVLTFAGPSVVLSIFYFLSRP